MSSLKEDIKDHCPALTGDLELFLNKLRYFAWVNGEANTCKLMDDILGGTPTEVVFKKINKQKQDVVIKPVD